MTAHWGVPDPAAVVALLTGSRRHFAMLRSRWIAASSLFLSLPIASLDALSIKKEITRIGAMMMSLSRRLAAEFLGTAFLLLAVVGSGIMGRAALGWKRCHRTSRQLQSQLAPHSIALILTFWPGLGGAFQSRRDTVCCVARRIGMRNRFFYSTAPRKRWRVFSECFAPTSSSACKTFFSLVPHA